MREQKKADNVTLIGMPAAVRAQWECFWPSVWGIPLWT